MIESISPVDQREKLQNHRIAVATTTYYKGWSLSNVGEINDVDQLRGDLAIETIGLAKERGYKVVVVDGGSSNDFRERLDFLGVKVLEQQEKGMGASRRQTFKEASILPGVEIICWTEPEKFSMVENLNQAAEPIFEGKADIVVPARTEKSFETYPDQQVKLEKQLNHKYSNILRLMGLLPENSTDLDPSFGPRLFRNDPEILKLFTSRL